MGKTTIIEAQNSSTVYEGGQAKGILGKITGPFADYIHGTRNADRKYIEELWDKRVFGSEDVMEALETGTLFGELDHPEGDRCETLAKNAAISIVKLEKKPDEGIIYGEALVLDTPTGRILKTLADSGAKLGISSRGIGEEIMRDGENIIDPDTYDFITFDVVVTPANEVARVSLTESKHFAKLTESFERELKECETENQVNQLKSVVESTNISNKDNIMKQITEKLDSFSVPQMNTRLTEANKAIAYKILEDKYIKCAERLKENINKNRKLASSNKSLKESNEFLTKSRNTLKEKLKENLTNKETETKLIEAQKLIETLTNQLKLEKINHKRNVAQAKLELEKKLAESKEMLDRQAEESNTKTVKLESQIKELKENNNKLAESVNKNSKIILESKKVETDLKTKLEKYERKEQAYSKILVENKESNSKVKQLEAKVQQLEDRNERFSKLAFNPLGTVGIKAESKNPTQNLSDEDVALFNILTNK